MRVAQAYALLLGSVFALAGACSTSTAPLGKGNDFTSDVDADDDSQVVVGDDGAYDDGFFSRVDSGYSLPPDGYVPFDWCTQCGCPSGTYCFGGGSGYTTFNGDCHADAGEPLEGGGLAIGCYPFPSVCANEPSCECIIAAASQYMPCYPVCSITTNIVYCPNP
jgi:hypothetical protein